MDPSVASSSNIVWGSSNGNFTKYRKLRYYDSQKGVIVMKRSQEEKSQSYCSEDPVGCVKLSEKKLKVLNWSESRDFKRFNKIFQNILDSLSKRDSGKQSDGDEMKTKPVLRRGRSRSCISTEENIKGLQTTSNPIFCLH